MFETVKGLVLRASDYGDHDRILTVLTKDGKRTVTVKGAHSIKNRYLSVAQPLCYAEFTLDSKRDRTWLREASLIENFFGIRQEIGRYALALYAAEVACEVCMENNDEGDMLSLLLNTLYVLSVGTLGEEQIKATFELRAAVILGFMPDLSACRECGKKEADRMYLDVMDGVLLCSECFFGKGEGALPQENETDHTVLIMPLSSEVLRAMRYVIYCGPKRIFSYTADETVLKQFAAVCEAYFLNHVERGFRSLTFYKAVSDPRLGETAGN